MSSTPSPAVTEPTGHQAALVDVAEQSFFAMAELCGAGEVEDEIAAEPAWLRAHMPFSSDHERGLLTIVLPAALAHDLSAAFSGSDPAELTVDLVHDLTGELCNMVCGLWLTRSCPHDRFRLQPPDVAEVAAPRGGPRWTFARINGVPVAIEASREPL